MGASKGVEMTWLYVASDPGPYTVGFFDPNGIFHRGKDCQSLEETERYVNYLNGGTGESFKFAQEEPDQNEEIGFIEIANRGRILLTADEGVTWFRVEGPVFVRKPNKVRLSVLSKDADSTIPFPNIESPAENPEHMHALGRLAFFEGKTHAQALESFGPDGLNGWLEARRDKETPSVPTSIDLADE
jgi:hypothetical protein